MFVDNYYCFMIIVRVYVFVLYDYCRNHTQIIG